MNKTDDLSSAEGGKLHPMVVTSMLLQICHIIKLGDTQGAGHLHLEMNLSDVCKSYILVKVSLLALHKSISIGAAQSLMYLRRLD